MYTYRLHDTEGDDLGTIVHPAPNVEPGDVIATGDGRRWLVERMVEAVPGTPIYRLLEVSELPSFSALWRGS